jgi:uncharacterized protein DUF2625
MSENIKILEELINKEDPFIDVLNGNISKASNEVSVLPPSDKCEDILLKVQVTTHSILGSLIYHTGGILIDHGWVRLLGSGNKLFPRNVYDWNQGNQKGIYMVADDAAGGFYAINCGAFSGERNIVHYWAPDTMEWESLGFLYSDFVKTLLISDLNDFYEGLRWQNWKEDIVNISTDHCMSFYPPLWTEEGNCETSFRSIIPITEALNSKCDIVSQL